MKGKEKVRVYDNNWPIVAMCYDFDKTLSQRDMQEYTIIPKLGIEAKNFWEISNQFAKDNQMDKILSYMFKIVDLANKNEVKITESDFKKMGKKVQLFPGVETWFDRINAIGFALQLNIEHYIISAGLKEIIQGTTIAAKFERIYASCFLYDKTYKSVKWVKQAVNYTGKTQYLFRINKGSLDLSDEDTINKFMEDYERRIPFNNFIYIGDSDTDIPAMKVVTKEKGYAIGVYNKEEEGLKKACSLLYQERINYFAPADYSENSRLEELIKMILASIKSKENLTNINDMQNYLSYCLGDFVKYFNRLSNSLSSGELDPKDCKKLIANSYKEMRKILESIQGLPTCDLESAIALLDGLKNKISATVTTKKKEQSKKSQKKAENESDNKK